jgi:hypothetical protein
VPGSRGLVVPPPRHIGADFSGISVCMHRRARSVTAASMIAELPRGLDEGAPLRVWIAPGSPCASIYVPAFPRSVAGPPPFVSLELSSEELWLAADAVRQRVEDDPDALGEVRTTLDPVEDELWAEADAVVEHPGRWASVGTSWGVRVLDALRLCIR